MGPERTHQGTTPAELPSRSRPFSGCALSSGELHLSLGERMLDNGRTIRHPERPFGDGRLTAQYPPGAPNRGSLRKRPMKQRLFWVLAGIIVSSTAAPCQVITGNIVGHITDASGALVPKAAVIIRNSDTGISVTVEADESGAYAAPDLPAGMYDVSARQQGFRIETVTGLQLLAQQTARLDFRLEVATVQQRIEVKAQPQLVHTDSQTIHSSINERQLIDLPTTSRSIDGLMILAPGVTGFGNVSNISNP